MADEELQTFGWYKEFHNKVKDTAEYKEAMAELVREELQEDIKELCRYVLKDHDALANFMNGFKSKKSTCNCPDCQRARRILKSYGEDN